MIQVSCLNCLVVYDTYPSRLGKTKYCSRRCLALSKASLLFANGNTINLGRELSQLTKNKIANAHKGKRSVAKSLSKQGSKNPNWRGGTSPENKRLRMSADFKAWRKAVFERDDYTCQMCGERGGVRPPDSHRRYTGNCARRCKPNSKE